MYARFLEEAGYEESALAAEAAECWTRLATALQKASESEEPRPALWSRIGEDASGVLEAERELWTALGKE
jgi:hypothetical protein